MGVAVKVTELPRQNGFDGKIRINSHRNRIAGGRISGWTNGIGSYYTGDYISIYRGVGVSRTVCSNSCAVDFPLVGR